MACRTDWSALWDHRVIQSQRTWFIGLGINEKKMHALAFSSQPHWGRSILEKLGLISIILINHSKFGGSNHQKRNKLCGKLTFMFEVWCIIHLFNVTLIIIFCMQWKLWIIYSQMDRELFCKPMAENLAKLNFTDAKEICGGFLRS